MQILKNIPNIIAPELMKWMMEMGHHDKLAIVDANFPAKSLAKRYIHVGNVNTDELLKAILSFYPLDHFIEQPVVLMKNEHFEPTPEVWVEYEKVIKENDFSNAFSTFSYVERLNYYHLSKEAYCIVQTNDVRRYANIMIQKGVC